MARSVKKGPYIQKSLYDKILAINKNSDIKTKKMVKTYSRSSTILPEAVGFVISVYNGKNFIPVYITEDLVGHKLGEFSPTRLFRGHAGTNKKGRKG